MPTLIICSRFEAERQLTTRGGARPITHVVSIGGYGAVIPDGFEEHPGPKLRLTFDDVLEAGPGSFAARPEDLLRLVEFARGIPDAGSKVLVHCEAGISRAPAVAFVLLCSMMEPGTEEDAMGMIRTLAPSAVPNPRIVELGDRALCRQGALMRALYR